MSRVRWAIVLALMIITLFSLSFASPPVMQEVRRVSSLPDQTATSHPPTPQAVSTAHAETSRPAQTEAILTPTAVATPTLTPTVTPTPFPFDAHPELARYVYVDQATQHMYVFENGKLIRAIPCSAGLPDPDKYTPEWTGKVGEYWGTFFAYEVYADEAWYLFKSAGSILIHGLPYTWHNGRKVYQDQDTLGLRPSSHGCIRILPEDAVWFTAWGPEGVPITISDPYLGKWRASLPTATASPEPDDTKLPYPT